MSEFEKWRKEYEKDGASINEIDVVLTTDAWNAAIEATAEMLEGQQRFMAASQVRKLSQKETDRGVPIPTGSDSQ